MQLMGTILYNGTDHGCCIDHNRGYWTNLTVARTKCANWPECECLYNYTTSGVSRYYAGNVAFEEGTALWKKEHLHLIGDQFLLTKHNSLFMMLKHIVLTDVQNN